MRASAIVAGILAVLACAAPGQAVPAVATGELHFSTLGTPLEMSGPVHIRCRWIGGVRLVHVYQLGRRDGPAWYLEAALRDVRHGRLIGWPYLGDWRHPGKAVLFAGDGRNEASSADEQARGWLRVHSARCGRRARVRFSVRGRLGSEFVESVPITVWGSITVRRAVATTR